MRNVRAKKERKEIKKQMITARQLAERVYEEFGSSVNKMKFHDRLKVALKIMRKKL